MIFKTKVCIPDDPMNRTCTVITLHPSLFRSRVIPTLAMRTITKAAVQPVDGYARRLGRQQTRVCAWLERGGIFESAPGPPSQPRALLHDRLRCSASATDSDNASRWGPPPNGCSPVWADFDDPRAVTFKWIGTDGRFN